MKKQTIWILNILMGVALIGLLLMQIFYMRNMVRMRYDQFEQIVKQSLHAVTARVNYDETRRYLDEDVDSIESSSIYNRYIGETGVRYTFTTSTGLRGNLTIEGNSNKINLLSNSDRYGFAPEYSPRMNYKMSEQYIAQKNIMDDVILDIISKSSDRPIMERLNPETVSKYLRQELDTLGLNLPFEYAIVNRAGVPVYKTAAFDPTPDDEGTLFVQSLFPRDPINKQYFLQVYFPTKDDFVYSSMSFMIPSFAFTIILLIAFVFVIILAFRQKSSPR